jgi:hypothetical protein
MVSKMVVIAAADGAVRSRIENREHSLSGQ